MPLRTGLRCGAEPSCRRSCSEVFPWRTIGTAAFAATQSITYPDFAQNCQHLTPQTLPSQANCLAIGDALEFDTFVDYRYVRDNRVPINAHDDIALMSVGCGAHYTRGRFIDFRVENAVGS